MITGVLKTGSGSDIYITGEGIPNIISVRSGQYLYLAVRGSWIPVIIKYSPQTGGWVFQNLENINVNGQKVMLKS